MASVAVRAPLFFSLAWSAAASVALGPNVYYFRHHNMDRSSSLAVSSDAASVVLNEWDVAINLFDSAKDVRTQRIDVTGPPNATVSLYSRSAPLALPEGPMYIFHNSTNLTLTDIGGRSYGARKSDAVVWIGQGSCLQLSVQLSPDGEASLMTTSSGAVPWGAPPGGAAPSCRASAILVGAGVEVQGDAKHGSSFFYNRIDYALTDGDACTAPLTHGKNGYSQTDEPIGPLASHYHTRGALYYSQWGPAKFNDEAAPFDTIYTGEMRFVNTGVYYGPEEMCGFGSDACFVASVHEADPAALDPVDRHPASECPFACMNKLHNKTFATCARRASPVVVV